MARRHTSIPPIKPNQSYPPRDLGLGMICSARRLDKHPERSLPRGLKHRNRARIRVCTPPSTAGSPYRRQPHINTSNMGCWVMRVHRPSCKISITIPKRSPSVCRPRRHHLSRLSDKATGHRLLLHTRIMEVVSTRLRMEAIHTYKECPTAPGQLSISNHLPDRRTLFLKVLGHPLTAAIPQICSSRQGCTR